MGTFHRRLNRRKWERTRRKVFDRDGWRCTECGKAGRLEADHVTPLWKDPEQDPYDAANCQTLCRTCHIGKTRREGEGYRIRKRKSRSCSTGKRWIDLVNKRLAQ